MDLSQTSGATLEIECYVATLKFTTLNASAIPRRLDDLLATELHVLNIALLRRKKHIYHQRRREPDLPSLQPDSDFAILRVLTGLLSQQDI